MPGKRGRLGHTPGTGGVDGAGRPPPATPTAFHRQLARMARMIEVAAKESMAYDEANAIWHEMDRLWTEFEARVLCLAPDYPEEEEAP